MKKTNEKKQYIYGRHPVEELLEKNPKKVVKVFLRSGVQKNFQNDIEKLVNKNKIKFEIVGDKDIASMVGDVNSQGIVAEIESSMTPFSSWKDRVDVSKNPAVLLFQEIQDPHNAGAMIRTAVASGISAILVPKHNQSPLDGAVWKTSAGMIENIEVVEIGNVNETIKKLKDVGFWVFGIDEEGKENFWDVDMNMPIVFVIGSEGSGTHALTRDLCDFLINIPMEGKVPSLNASVSAALVMYEWKRRRNSK